MSTLSLFSGIGGLDLGLARAGFRIVAQCESDPFCRPVLARHWPGVPCFRDIRELVALLRPPRRLPRYLRAMAAAVRARLSDLFAVVGGFPCQDISVAGLGAGVDGGARSGLWKEMRRVIAVVRPRWVIAENVPALRTRGADRVLGDLERLGYTCWPLVVGVEHVGGPHKRHRVFILADAACAGFGADRRARRSQGHPDELGEMGHAGGAGREKRNVSGESVEPGQSCWRRDPSLADAHAIAGAAELVPGQPGHEAALARGSGRWPARPGEPRHEWEAPRLLELPMGGSVDGVPARLVRLANRNALRAYGNAVCPVVAEVVGRAVMAHGKK